MQNENTLVETLCHSKIYQEYERAFSEATGLPLALRPVESWQLPHHRERKENPFCALLAERSKACAACLQVQQALAEKAADGPDRKSTRLNSSHSSISYAVFCLKKKKKKQ